MAVCLLLCFLCLRGYSFFFFFAWLYGLVDSGHLSPRVYGAKANKRQERQQWEESSMTFVDLGESMLVV